MGVRSIQHHSSQPPGQIPHPYWAIILAILFILACASVLRGCTETPVQSAAVPATQPVIVNTSLAFTPTRNSHVELHGTATIGAWTAQSADVGGQVALDVDMAAIDSLFNLIQPAGHDASDPPTLKLPLRSPAIITLSVPVTTLKGDSNGMTKDLHNALGADKHPTIDYTFIELQSAQIQANGNNNGLNLHVAGQLTMAGTQKPIAMDVFIYRDAQKHFRARTQSTMNMSDFGVTPPTALFGLIHAQNQVQVIFDLDLAQSNTAPSARP